MPHFTKAFTLVEILVVVSVIASISSVVLVGIKAAQASGRDSARQSSALQVRNALALYATDHGGVPAGSGVSGCTPQTTGGVTSDVCKGETAVQNALGAALVPKYISHIPVDMVNTNGLEYSYITAAPDPVLTAANGGKPTTATAAFAYVSELKSVDPVSDPVVVTVPVGEANYASYSTTGYPGGSLVVLPKISFNSVTGPTTGYINSSISWMINVSNPNNETISYTIDWGDGSTDTFDSSWTVQDPSGEWINMYHVYDHTAHFTVSFQISSPSGGSLSRTLGIDITEVPLPQTITVSPTTVHPGMGVHITGSNDGLFLWEDTVTLNNITISNPGDYVDDHTFQAYVPDTFIPGTYVLKVIDVNGHSVQTDYTVGPVLPTPAADNLSSATVTNQHYLEAHVGDTITVKGGYLSYNPYTSPFPHEFQAGDQVFLDGLPIPTPTTFVNSHTMTFAFPSYIGPASAPTNLIDRHSYVLTIVNPYGETRSPWSLQIGAILYPKQTLTIVGDATGGTGTGNIMGLLGLYCTSSGVPTYTGPYDTHTCSADFQYNTQATLTALPDSNSVFTSWGGACSGVQSTSCTVTMDAAKSVSARFTLK